MKKISVILVALVLSTVSFAAGKASPVTKANKVVSVVAVNPNLITGKVIDKNTNEALAGAIILCDNQKVYSDLDGNFSILKTKKASELSIGLISYTTITLKLNEIQDQCVSISLRQR
jgi:hypothetical protein